MKQIHNIGEFLRFCIVGLIATGIHYGVYLILNLWANVNIAYTIGYVVSLCCNLWLTAHFTFKKDVTPKRTGGFVVSHLINYVLHIVLLNLFLWLGLSNEIAPIPVYCIVVPINFVLIRTVFNRIR